MQGNALTPESIICKSLSQVSTEIDGETVLLSIDKGNYYGMNKVLSAIWQWLEQPITVADLRRKLTQTYDVADDVCERDVLKVLGDLQREGLIDIR
ncbi:MAG: coenzyme PQQ biosynthesis protein PqqD [Comamonadaceae bacterium]|nr:MAG: coenzyme PQQ biosynthesis protein PqqD [Comamonadaceae bacterium]